MDIRQIRLGKVAYPLLAFVFFILIWELSIIIFKTNSALFPSPMSVMIALLQSNDLWSDVAISMLRLTLGVIMGVSVGIMFGLITGRVAFVNNTLGNIANFFRFTPTLAIVPLFLVWFGIGESSKIFLLAWGAFFSVWISTHSGIKDLENKYLLVAKSLDVKRLFFWKNIILKGSINNIINGTRIGMGVAFMILIAAEMLGAYSGIGYRIFFFQSVYRIDKMVGYILVISLIGLLVDKIFVIMAKRFTPWKDNV